MISETLDIKEIKEIKKPNESYPKIEYLVINGGPLTCGGNLGILQKSHEDGFWNIQDIKAIYGTSMGGILGVFIALLNRTSYTQNYIYDWQMVEDYFVKRPWQNVFKMDLMNIMNSFQNRGIFSISTVHEMYAPVFNALDISMNVSMSEFFEITQIDFHVYTVDLATFKIVDISYKTHPNWELLEAIYCSACIPFLFSPYKKDGMIYVDGGFLLNYPLQPCLQRILDSISNKNLVEEEEETPKEKKDSYKIGILGINRKKIDTEVSVDDDSSLFDYIICIFNKIMEELGLHTLSHFPKIPDSVFLYETHLQSDFFSLYKIFNIASSPQIRAELLEKGKQTWNHLFHITEESAETNTAS